MLGLIFPNILAVFQAAVHFHPVDEADAFKSLAIEPIAVQLAMAKIQRGIA